MTAMTALRNCLAAALLAAAGGVSLAQTAPAPAPQSPPANRWTAAQIQQAFELADTDADGRLSRAEAQRLPLMPRSFEDTDTNRDGVVVLAEYLASFQ
jgi:hypothetical protein